VGVLAAVGAGALCDVGGRGVEGGKVELAGVGRGRGPDRIHLDPDLAADDALGFGALVGRRRVAEVNGVGEALLEADGSGRLRTLTNPFSEVTTLAYDADGREVSRQLANGITVSNGYDASSRLVTRQP
jgi:YD repeat-containing protein